MTDALPATALDQLFRAARSFNAYLDRPVEEATLRALYDLVKMGPTSANMQPLRILWCVSDAAKETLAAAASGSNAAKIRAAPVTAILATDAEFYEKLPALFPHADARSWYVGNDAMIETAGFRNSSMQAGYFILAARALGLGTGPMSGFDNARVDAAFFAGTSWRSNLIVTLGYGDPASVFGRLPRLDFDEATRIA